MSSSQPLLDAAGRRRSPATTPGARAGIAPRNKGERYPADPPAVDEIVAVMRQVGHARHGHRLSALIVVLWRAGLRIQEALSLTETDLDQRRGSILVTHGRTIAGARSAWTGGVGRPSSHGWLTAWTSRSGRCSA
jgi:integrase